MARSTVSQGNSAVFGHVCHLRSTLVRTGYKPIYKVNHSIIVWVKYTPYHIERALNKLEIEPASFVTYFTSSEDVWSKLRF